MIDIIIVLGVSVLVAAGVLIARCYKKVGPNRVLIVSGRRGVYTDPSTGERVERSFKIFHGGGTLVLPLREKIDIMSVELMTLEIRTPEFFTKFGVPIVVDGIAQIKVKSEDPIAVATAAEMFLSKSAREMNEIAHQMMQGHLRAVISTMPFEEIHANPEAFAQSVQRLTSEDLANMGIQVVSFTIREIQDPSGYLQALGRPQLAEVQKNALVGEANADRDANMGQALAQRQASITAARARQDSELARLDAEVAIANAQAEKDRKLQELGSTVSEARAENDLAYELQTTKTRQMLLQEELNLQVLAIQRRENELVESVQKPVEAERRRIETLAEAERMQRRTLAEADADAERARGHAEADVIRARGEAEAEAIKSRALAEATGLQAKLEAEAKGMREKAEAWRHYGSAALGQLLIERLPEVAAAVAAPLGKVERIVLVSHGGDSSSGVERITRGVTDVMAQMPAIVETLSGIDLRGLLRNVAAQSPLSASADAGAEPAPSTAAGTGSNGAIEVSPNEVHYAG